MFYLAFESQAWPSFENSGREILCNNLLSSTFKGSYPQDYIREKR